MSRKCEYCSGPMPETKASHARYCSERCCTLEHNRRRTQKLFDDGWKAAMETVAYFLGNTPGFFYAPDSFIRLGDEELDLKPPKVKINAKA